MRNIDVTLFLIYMVLFFVSCSVLDKLDKINNTLSRLDIRTSAATDPKSDVTPIESYCYDPSISENWFGADRNRGVIDEQLLTRLKSQGGDCLLLFGTEIKLVLKTNATLVVDARKVSPLSPTSWNVLKGTLFEFTFTPDPSNRFEFYPTLP